MAEGALVVDTSSGSNHAQDLVIRLEKEWESPDPSCRLREETDVMSSQAVPSSDMAPSSGGLVAMLGRELEPHRVMPTVQRPLL